MGLLTRGRRFSELEPARLGVIAALVLAVLLTAALNVGKLTDALSGASYSAIFAEAGGLKSGDPVRVSGVQIGKVRSVDIEGNRIRVEFSAERELGGQTRLAIKSETLLGAKFLDVESRGSDVLAAGAEIPLNRTKSPYDLPEALADLTNTGEKIATTQLADSLDTLSAAFANTPKSVRGVLSGTERLARVVSSRDADLTALLEHAEGVSGVLAQRNLDVIGILSDGSRFLGALQQHRAQVRRLFLALTQVSTQMSAIARENEDELAPTLTELRRSLRVINKHLDDLNDTIDGFSGFARSLLEGVGGGTFFYGYLAGIAPASMRPVLDGVLEDLLPQNGTQP